MTVRSVTVGMNNQVFADEAAQDLGCSYSHMVNLLKSKKIKGQKLEGRWVVDYEDLQKAKSMHLVTPRGPLKVARKSMQPAAPAVEEGIIKLQIPRHKLDLIRFVLDKTGNKKTLLSYLNEQIDKLYNDISDKLSTIEL